MSDHAGLDPNQIANLLDPAQAAAGGLDSHLHLDANVDALLAGGAMDPHLAQLQAAELQAADVQLAAGLAADAHAADLLLQQQGLAQHDVAMPDALHATLVEGAKAVPTTDLHGQQTSELNAETFIAPPNALFDAYAAREALEPAAAPDVTTADMELSADNEWLRLPPGMNIGQEAADGAALAMADAGAGADPVAVTPDPYCGTKTETWDACAAEAAHAPPASPAPPVTPTPPEGGQPPQPSAGGEAVHEGAAVAARDPYCGTKNESWEDCAPEVPQARQDPQTPHAPARQDDREKQPGPAQTQAEDQSPATDQRPTTGGDEATQRAEDTGACPGDADPDDPLGAAGMPEPQRFAVPRTDSVPQLKQPEAAPVTTEPPQDGVVLDRRELERLWRPPGELQKHAGEDIPQDYRLPPGFALFGMPGQAQQAGQAHHGEDNDSPARDGWAATRHGTADRRNLVDVTVLAPERAVEMRKRLIDTYLELHPELLLAQRRREMAEGALTQAGYLSMVDGAEHVMVERDWMFPVPPTQPEIRPQTKAERVGAQIAAEAQREGERREKLPYDVEEAWQQALNPSGRGDLGGALYGALRMAGYDDEESEQYTRYFNRTLAGALVVQGLRNGLRARRAFKHYSGRSRPMGDLGVGARYSLRDTGAEVAGQHSLPAELKIELFGRGRVSWGERKEAAGMQLIAPLGELSPPKFPSVDYMFGGKRERVGQNVEMLRRGGGKASPVTVVDYVQSQAVWYQQHSTDLPSPDVGKAISVKFDKLAQQLKDNGAVKLQSTRFLALEPIISPAPVLDQYERLTLADPKRFTVHIAMTEAPVTATVIEQAQRSLDLAALEYMKLNVEHGLAMPPISVIISSGFSNPQELFPRFVPRF